MKRLLGSSGVALLFLGCFSLFVLSQSRERTHERGGRRHHEAHVPPAAVLPGSEEWIAGAYPAVGPMGPESGNRFGWKRLLDVNADGEISVEEIDEMLTNLKALDVDQNGTLSEDELPPHISWHVGSPPFDAEAAFAPHIAAVDGQEE